MGNKTESSGWRLTPQGCRIEEMEQRSEEKHYVRLAERILESEGRILSATGSLSCLRAIYMTAERMGAADRFVFCILSAAEYATGQAETSLRKMIQAALRERSCEGIVIYASCMEVITRLDFDHLLHSLQNPDGVPVRMLYRGPMVRRYRNPPEDLEQMIAEMPERGVCAGSGVSLLPPPMPDFEAVAGVLQDYDVYRILLSGGGCDGCIEKSPLLSSGFQLRKTRMTDLDAAAGCEDRVSSVILDDRKGQGEHRLCCILGSAMPAAIGMDFRRISGNLAGSGVRCLVIPTDGFHTAQEGLSTFYRILAEAGAAEEGPGCKLQSGARNRELPAGRAEQGPGGKLPAGTSEEGTECELPAGTAEKGPGTEEAETGTACGGRVGVLGAHVYAAASREKINHGLEHLSWDGYRSLFPEDMEVPDFREIAGADLSWVVTAEGIEAAEHLRKKCGIPYIAAVPVGMHSMLRWRGMVAEALQGDAGEKPAVPEPAAAAAEQPRILIAGDPVLTAGIACWLREMHGMLNVVRAVYAPVRTQAAWYRKVLKMAEPYGCGDIKLSEVIFPDNSEKWSALVQEADIVIADAVMQCCLRETILQGKRWIDLPDPLLSHGIRLTMPEYTIFGKKGAAWIEGQL